MDKPVSAPSSAMNKTGTVRRELTLLTLVVPDLKQMEATGKFDRNVLLWLQDAYVSRAMKENAGELVVFHRQLGQQGLSAAEKRDEQNQFLAKITKETYSTIKGEGGGFDLKQYVDAAKAFYESESVLYAGQLQEVAEYIKKSLAAGVPPDLERFAREAYVSMARMSSAQNNLTTLGTRANANYVAQMMKRGIEAINFAVVTTPGQSIEVGKQLLKVVEKIAAAPHKYVQFVNPDRLETPNFGAWDFETERRGAQAGLSM